MVRSSRRGAVIVGVVFLITGLALWAVPEAPLEIKTLFPVLGVIVLAIGLVLVLGRSGTVVDRERRVVTRWWGLLWRMRITTDTLDGVERVELARVARRTRRGQIYYAISLHGASAPIPLYTSSCEATSRAMADQVASFLQLDVHDKIYPLSTLLDAKASRPPEPIIRRPGEIAVPVVERICSGLEKIDRPPPPAKMRSQVELSPDRVTVTFPRQGFAPGLQLMALGGIVIIGFFTAFPFIAIQQMRDMRNEMRREIHGEVDDSPHPMEGIAYCMLVPAGLLAILFACLIIGAATAQVRIEITPRGVEVRGGLWKQFFGARELDEIRVEGETGKWPKSCCVFLRAGRTSTRIGDEKTSREECEYLEALIKTVVSKQELVTEPERG